MPGPRGSLQGLARGEQPRDTPRSSGARREGTCWLSSPSSHARDYLQHSSKPRGDSHCTSFIHHSPRGGGGQGTGLGSCPTHRARQAGEQLTAFLTFAFWDSEGCPRALGPAARRSRDPALPTCTVGGSRLQLGSRCRARWLELESGPERPLSAGLWGAHSLCVSIPSFVKRANRGGHGDSQPVKHKQGQQHVLSQRCLLGHYLIPSVFVITLARAEPCPPTQHPGRCSCRGGGPHPSTPSSLEASWAHSLVRNPGVTGPCLFCQLPRIKYLL